MAKKKSTQKQRSKGNNDLQENPEVPVDESIEEDEDLLAMFGDKEDAPSNGVSPASGDIVAELVSDDYSDDKLSKIIIDRENYQKEAVDTAFKIISERGIDDKLQQELDNIKQSNEKIEQKQFEEFEKIRNINLKNVINLKLADAANFEYELTKHGISFHREDKNLTGGVELYPSLNYYFSDMDFELADKIYIKLGLTDAHQNITPFFKFEMKVFMFIIIIVILGLLILF